jgi:phosphoribosylaminoimidazolecarboxamide formyltransferase/IMP cyclohydrolase
MNAAAKPRALLSVSDKTGITELARALHEHGYELVSTGGTARHLTDAGLPIRETVEKTGCICNHFGIAMVFTGVRHCKH